MRLMLEIIQVHPPKYSLSLKRGVPTTWGKHISDKIQEVSEVLALPFSVNQITVSKYKDKDNRYGHIIYRTLNGENCYDIYINMLYCDSVAEQIRTINHELSHLLEHYVHERFTHEERFEEMIAYIQGGI